MAKPTLVAARWASLSATAVLMPMTWPAALTSGPPELPDEIAASVWINPSRASVWLTDSVRSSAETIPAVTVGSPSRSRAKPMATTGSPIRMLAGSANVAAGSSASMSTRSSARSLSGSEAITVAGVGSVLPEKRTRTSWAPATTWALVRISPSAEMTTPVPTASPASWPSLTVALTVTTLGPTVAATAATSMSPAEACGLGAAPPAICTWLTVVAGTVGTTIV